MSAMIPNQPDLAVLASILRHPELWPHGFTWNYEKYRRGPIGLAKRLWPDISKSQPFWWRGRAMRTWIAREMAMPYEASRIFFSLGPLHTFSLGGEKFTCPDGSRVSPDNVADEIDKYLANKGAR